MNDRYVTIGKKIEAGLRAAIPAVWVCAGLLTACTADDLPAPEAGEVPPATLPAAGIYVSGGRPDVALSTGKRYVEPGDTESGPHIDGICKADRVDVFMFTNERGYYDDEAQETECLYEQTVSNTLAVVGYDRYAVSEFSCYKENGAKYIYGAALAYKADEDGMFSMDLEGKNRTNFGIQIVSGTSAPELYYGVVRVDGASVVLENEKENVAYKNEDDEGDRFWWGHYHTGPGCAWGKPDTYINAKFKGRIFRIVSQINLEVTEVEKSLVKSMELLANNILTQITLYGTHGGNYPVTACKEEGNTSGATMVSLDKVSFKDEDETGDTTVVLSSFFLPSEVGMKLRLRIEYRQEIDSDGNKSKDYELQPARSYYLTGDDAEVYNVDEGLKNGNDLYVYDGRNYCFYSYANVRVNLSGHFENFATDTGDANITIEVEPNFEKDHHYEIATN